jgi:hypothetical protein
MKSIFIIYLVSIHFLIAIPGEKSKLSKEKALEKGKAPELIPYQKSKLSIGKKIKHAIIPAPLERFFHVHLCLDCRHNPEQNSMFFVHAVGALDSIQILELIDRKGINVDTDILLNNPWQLQHTWLSVHEQLDTPHAQPIFKGTPLCWAVLKGHVELVKELLKRNANSNKESFIQYPSYTDLHNVDLIPVIEKDFIQRKKSENGESSKPFQAPLISYTHIGFTPYGGLLYLPQEIHVKKNTLTKEKRQLDFKSTQCMHNQDTLKALLLAHGAKIEQNEIYQVLESKKKSW